jgi:hypothetical protein
MSNNEQLTSLLDEENTEDTSIDETANPVIPEKTGNSSWENYTHT